MVPAVDEADANIDIDADRMPLKLVSACPDCGSVATGAGEESGPAAATVIARNFS